MPDSNSNSSVEILGVEQLPPRPQRLREVKTDPPPQSRPFQEPPAPQPLPEPPVIVQRVGIPEAILSVFAALGFALSARLLLLLAIIGAFVLAMMAMQNTSYQTIGIFVAYALLVIVPLVYLETKGKRPEA